jgi:hypothetical protein
LAPVVRFGVWNEVLTVMPEADGIMAVMFETAWKNEAVEIMFFDSFVRCKRRLWN